MARTTSNPLHVFAYGSLMSEPAAPDHVIAQQRASLDGWRRVFHQRSHTRGCPPELAPDCDAVPGFVNAQGVRYSLALGLVPDPGTVVGVSFAYDGTHQEAVLAELERREGPGYLGRTLEVRQADGSSVTAWSWVSRAGHPRVVDLSLADQARILIAGTPIRDVDGRARGVQYLYDVVNSLERLGAPDPNLAELVRHVRDGFGVLADR